MCSKLVKMFNYSVDLLPIMVFSKLSFCGFNTNNFVWGIIFIIMGVSLSAYIIGLDSYTNKIFSK